MSGEELSGTRSDEVSDNQHRQPVSPLELSDDTDADISRIKKTNSTKKQSSNIEIENVDTITILSNSSQDNDLDNVTQKVQDTSMEVSDQLSISSSSLKSIILPLTDRDKRATEDLLYRCKKNADYEVGQDRADPSSDAGRSENYYIDLSRMLKEVLEIHKDHGTGRMQAKMVPRIEKQAMDDFSWIQSENLLDQIITAIRASEYRNPVIDVAVSSGPRVRRPTPPNISSLVKGFEFSEFVTEELEAYQNELGSIFHKSGISSRDNAARSVDVIIQSPIVQGTNEIVDCPIFYPTRSEFKDPITYIKSITNKAERFGLCKVVAPKSFRPLCVISKDIRFRVLNQHVERMFHRWGPAVQELCIIKASLANQYKVIRAPQLNGVKVNLLKLHDQVRLLGGLEEVVRKNEWDFIADQIGIPKCPISSAKLEQIYWKFLLTYQTLSPDEKSTMTKKVADAWERKKAKLTKKSSNPHHWERKLLGHSDSAEKDLEDECVRKALAGIEECVVPGPLMQLPAYKKMAKNYLQFYFPNAEDATTKQIESKFWALVSKRTELVCVNAAAIDTGEHDCGFSTYIPDRCYGLPWNLKTVGQNSQNILRSLGPVPGVTVPTLHLGMVFASRGWYGDRYDLHELDYMHQGPTKVWYGVPSRHAFKLRSAVRKLRRTASTDNPAWLNSDVTMIPPQLLLENNVPLTRVEQNPGEFIVVFPKAYSCCLSTGFTISESTKFASPESWLTFAHGCFRQLKSYFEPTMFSLEHLLVAMAESYGASLAELQRVHFGLNSVVSRELAQRRLFIGRLAGCSGAGSCKMVLSALRSKRRLQRADWNILEQDKCDVCRSTLFFSKVLGLINDKSILCLDHAVKLWFRVERRPVTVAINFTDDDLNRLLVSVANRAKRAK